MTAHAAAAHVPAPVSSGTAFADDTPPLPPGLASVADLRGDISVARVRGRSEREVVRHLLRHGVDYYFPLQLVRRWYAGRKREWTTAFIPGHLFVGGGYDGRAAVAEYGRQFAGRVFGFIGLADSAGMQRQLRSELGKIELLLGNDPTLSARAGIARGVAVRVVAGPFAGWDGVVETVGPRCTFWVRLDLLGQSVPVEVPGEHLERV